MKLRSLASLLPNARPWTQSWMRKGRAGKRGWEIGRVKRSIAGLPGKAKEQS